MSQDSTHYTRNLSAVEVTGSVSSAPGRPAHHLSGDMDGDGRHNRLEARVVHAAGPGKHHVQVVDVQGHLSPLRGKLYVKCAEKSKSVDIEWG